MVLECGCEASIASRRANPRRDGTSTSLSEKLNTPTFSPISRSNTARPYAASVRCISERCENEVFVHTDVAHVAQVAEQSQRTKLFLTEQSLPSLALVSTRAQRHFPSVRSGKFPGDQALPHFSLRLVTRLGVSQEQHVTEFDRSAAIVLRERVGIELREGRSQPLLHLSGERHATVLPVDGDELGELVGTLDHTRQRLGHQSSMRGVTRHLTHEQKRRVTQLHLLASFDGERSHILSRDLGDEFRDAARDLDSVLIELALPEQACQHRAPQLQLRGDVARRSTFVRARTKVQVE